MRAARRAAVSVALVMAAGCARVARPVTAPTEASPITPAPRDAFDAAAPSRDALAAADLGASTDVAASPVVRRGDCFVRAMMIHPCHGTPLSADESLMRVEVCDGCRTNRDCRASAGGRCVEVAGNTCTLPARVCRYPHDACSACEERPTFERRGCVNDQLGHAVCMLMGGPPPAAPHH